MERQGIGRPSTYSPTIKTLKEREYVQLTKGKLQPTQLGRELDAFLAQVLPDLISSEFTANMEQQLDAIASGKLNWEHYLTNWNQQYFAPALAKAIAQIPQIKLTLTQQTKETKQKTSTKKAQEITNIQCPKCGKQMVKVPSKSAKVKAGHFLSCDSRQNGCGTVMFKNERSGNYELPYSQRQSQPSVTSVADNLTEILCPVCSSPLEKFSYADKKTGEAKTMLRCSHAQNRKERCKDVAFWWTSQQHWWSKVYGEIQDGAIAKPRKSSPKSPARKKRK
jgi:DNA topoisomerase-1